MHLSQETSELISELRKFSGSKIKDHYALGLLFESSRNSGKEKLLDDAAFTAKYLNGLGKILSGNISESPPVNGGKDQTITPEAIEKIRHEYKQNIYRLAEQLKELTSALEEKERKRFHSKYLSLTRESLASLTSLIYDLSWLKVYRNMQKRK